MNNPHDSSVLSSFNLASTIPASTVGDLINAVQALSLARDIDTVKSIVTTYARKLTGADGATFVLKDKDRCFYADEDAIAPLWKGRTFPLSACISGWVMLNRQVVRIKDIYQDERIPAEAYRPTFVKSLLMVPIRKSSPIAAIGNYWASEHEASDYELELLQALADSTSVALENIELYSQLQRKVRELQESNYELERYSWIASHDLREPLRTITTYLQLIEKKYLDEFDIDGKQYVSLAVAGSRRLQQLVTDILAHTHLTNNSSDFDLVDTAEVVTGVMKTLESQIKFANARIVQGSLPKIRNTTAHLTQLFFNLISNALKFRSPNRALHIQIGAEPNGSDWIFYVKDNGIGIDPQYKEKIFGMFQRLYPQDQYEGSGLGLSICKRIVELGHGKIWVESSMDKGATFYFTFPAVIPALESYEGRNADLPEESMNV